MAHVSYLEVQHWLDPEKLEIHQNDTLPEDDQIAPLVLGRLASAYDVSGWDDVSTTPAVVRKILAALIAANRYNKVYSESDDAGNRYANKLEAIMWDRINMIVGGQISLYDATDVLIADLADPKFWPTDQTGSLETLNALGNTIGYAGSADHKFSMAMEF